MKKIDTGLVAKVIGCFGVWGSCASCAPSLEDAVGGSPGKDARATNASPSPTYDPVPPLQRVYSVYSPTATDQLLTQHEDEALSLMFTGWGSSTGDTLYLERQPQSTTLPLRRFHKGPPQNEHFYTTSREEAEDVIAQGWVGGGSVGHIHVEQVPGSVPLHRLSRYDGATGDLVHRYTVDPDVLSSLKDQGFSYEGITGYVYRAATPGVQGGRIFGARLGCNGTDHRDCFFGSYVSVGDIGPRLAGSTKQVMRFKFWTPDMFKLNSDECSSSGEHLAFTPRGVLVADTNNLLRSKIHGIGLVIGDHTPCGGSARTFIEAWWPRHPAPPPDQPAWGGYNFDSAPTNTCSSNALANRTWYDVSASVSDDGIARYEVRIAGTSNVVASSEARYDAAPGVETPFDAGARGYFMTNAHEARRDYTAYVTDISVTWE